MKLVSPDIQFSIDGRPLTLRFSAKALAALQDYWELENLDQVSAKLAALEAVGLGVKDASAMIWAGLRTHHPEITIDDAFDLLDDIGLESFEALLGKAINGASSEGGGKASGNPRSPRQKRGQ